MTTDHAVSPGVSATEAMVSLVTLTLLYGVLAVIEVGLILRTVQRRAAAVRRATRPGHRDETDPTTTAAGVRVLRSRRQPWSSPPSGSSLIAVLWIGYFTLEGFDFGVGMLLPVLARDGRERRVMINTIGPVWDGNEVWVLIAGGATFAAFPEWYATLFSGFYLPLLLILVALIVRGAGLRVPPPAPRGELARAVGPRAIIVGSFVPALLWGVAFANIVRGVPLDADHEFTGSLLTLLNPYALLGGLVTLLLFLTHGAMFVSLKTDGEIRHRARALAVQLGGGAAVVAVAFLVWTQIKTGDRGHRGPVRGRGAVRWSAGLAAVRAGREGWAFAGTFATIALAVAGLFVGAVPRRDAVDHRRRQLA